MVGERRFRKRFLLGLLGLEKEKLAAAIAAEANLIPAAATNRVDRLSGFRSVDWVAGAVLVLATLVVGDWPKPEAR
ncbi:hypothetical protein GGD55_002355 [Rhizobium giardinii]|uniref:Uncharacterized protein n=1 Tax=Rhizobium giardinii TaxID=56731 RepID=A0A7W8UA54_9HYPH|nr:hypothetical protein [Rhizobium giardinii]